MVPSFSPTAPRQNYPSSNSARYRSPDISHSTTTASSAGIVTDCAVCSPAGKRNVCVAGPSSCGRRVIASYAPSGRHTGGAVASVVVGTSCTSFSPSVLASQ